MKTAYIIFVLLVAVIAVVFALQNSAQTTLSLLAWSTTGSLSLVLIITLVIGFILGMLVMVPSVHKRGKLSSGLKKKITAMEKDQAASAEQTPAGAGAKPAEDNKVTTSAEKG